MSVRRGDLGSLKVLYITSNRIYSSYSGRLHNNTVHRLVHAKVLQDHAEDRQVEDDSEPDSLI